MAANTESHKVHPHPVPGHALARFIIQSSIAVCALVFFFADATAQDMFKKSDLKKLSCREFDRELVVVENHFFDYWHDSDFSEADQWINHCTSFFHPERDPNRRAFLEERHIEVTKRNAASQESVVLLKGREAAEAAEKASVRAQLKAQPHAVPSGLTGREVRFFDSTQGTFTGYTVSANSIHEILFTREACSLPVEGAENMHRLWLAQSIDRVGCWYPLMDGTFVTIDGAGRMQSSRALWESFPRALLQADGSAVITEPDYDSDTFLQQVIGAKNRQWIKNLHERMTERP